MKEFFEELNRLARPGRRDIIEKDYHLHRMLHAISGDDYLASNLAFKGGTCLVKAYMGYYRFSEDIDFTWKKADIWSGRSTSQTKRRCSETITNLIDHFKVVSDELGLKFSGDKADPGHVHISSGGRMTTFYFGYASEILDRPERIKVEINFVERVLYPFRRIKLGSYVETFKSDRFKFLFKDPYGEYRNKVQLDCNDPREIFVEKCRAAITRRAYKLRDMIDIYYLEKNNGYTIRGYREQILEKSRFTLDMYRRYRENIEMLDFPEPDLLRNEEMHLMIVEPPEDLQEQIRSIHAELEDIKEAIAV